MKFIRTALPLLFILFLCQCQPPKPSSKEKTQRPALKQRISPQKIGYHFSSDKKLRDSLVKIASPGIEILTAVNRTDLAHLKQMDSILVPVDLTGDREFYLPFPVKVDGLSEISKIIFFSYPAQAFGAYEYGNLVYSGATNMGRKKDPTPTGLYYTNWKAEKTTSTFNDEWDLKWNFNIQNKEGIGWHEYELPGYPASHSCLRLTSQDAQYLYKWADEWKIQGTDNILANGTPVIVFGSYNFDGPKPWRALAQDPKALDISANAIEKEAAPFLKDITSQQEKREQLASTKKED